MKSLFALGSVNYTEKTLGVEKMSPGPKRSEIYRAGPGAAFKITGGFNPEKMTLIPRKQSDGPNCIRLEPTSRQGRALRQSRAAPHFGTSDLWQMICVSQDISILMKMAFNQ